MSLLRESWPYLLAAVIPAIQAAAAIHLILRKRNVRSAVGWMGLIWLTPLVGVILYAMFGINRIKRKARALRPQFVGYEGQVGSMLVDEAGVRELMSPARCGHLAEIVRLGDRVTRRSLLIGNSVVPLVDGDVAYPAMIEAIDQATRSVTLQSYIFDSGEAGGRFSEALGRAVRRGVEVRVLIDAVGARYSEPRMARQLRRLDVPVAHFMPSSLPWRAPYFNLRNHRKLLVVDGAVGFTGGMNIRDEFWHEVDPDHFALDLHFRLEGPVVAALQEVFAEDWTFTTKERLDGDAWFPPLEHRGPTLARGISDGPDIDFEKLMTMLLGALGSAESSVRIMTPYFLPEPSLMTMLGITAMRGVDVQVLLPDKSNLALVQWASTAQLDQVIESGVQVFQSPPPFDHSKLMVVDAAWTLIGSANWDARSLQLNFEFNVECYDAELGARMDAFFADRVARARPLTLDDLNRRSFPVKIRDGVARLFSPYL